MLVGITFRHILSMGVQRAEKGWHYPLVYGIFHYVYLSLLVLTMIPNFNALTVRISNESWKKIATELNILNTNGYPTRDFSSVQNLKLKPLNCQDYLKNVKINETIDTFVSFTFVFGTLVSPRAINFNFPP